MGSSECSSSVAAALAVRQQLAAAAAASEAVEIARKREEVGRRLGEVSTVRSALAEEVRRFKRAAEDRQAKLICRGRQRVEGEGGREEGKEGGGEGTW